MSFSTNCRTAFFVVLLVTICGFLDTAEGRRSNGLIRRCGHNAQHFLRWFCMDPTFSFPLLSHRMYVILRYRSPYKEIYPFQQQAATCCKYGCPESGYQRMCTYHKKLQLCEKKFNYRTTSGRRKRRLFSFCHRSQSLLT